MSTSETRRGIVVGVDGSAPSDAAVVWAAHEAAMRNVPLTVVHMVNAMVPMYPALPLSTGVAVWQEEHGREVLEQAAVNRAPHALVHYLRELANVFHTYYNAEQFIVDDPNLRNARLALVLGLQQVVRNGLTLLGVSAPESM